MQAGQGLMSAVTSYRRHDMGGVFRSVAGVVKTATTVRGAEQRARQTKTSPADVVCMTFCCFFQLLILCVDIVGWMQGRPDKCGCG